jgi:hypothetical protein
MGDGKGWGIECGKKSNFDPLARKCAETEKKGYMYIEDKDYSVYTIYIIYT